MFIVQTRLIGDASLLAFTLLVILPSQYLYTNIHSSEAVECSIWYTCWATSVCYRGMIILHRVNNFIYLLLFYYYMPRSLEVCST